MACGEDDFSELTANYTSEFCVVQSMNDSSLYLLTDGGIILNPVSSLDLNGYEENDRLRVTYDDVTGTNSSALNSKFIRIYGIQSVLVMDAISRDELAEKVDDPLWIVTNPWIAGGFLNFGFNFQHSNLDIKHSIFLINDKYEKDKGVNKLYLTFAHNAKMDRTNTTSSAFASFRLGSIEHINEADSLVISVLEGLIVKTYRIAAE
jgi:hypothetical protein